jgi:hypothetical protein
MCVCVFIYIYIKLDSNEWIASMSVFGDSIILANSFVCVGFCVVFFYLNKS